LEGTGKEWCEEADLNIVQDEYANHITNGAFTNAGVIVTMDLAMSAAELVGEKYPAKWKDIAENMAVPYNADANIVVEFQGMNGSVEIKQVDVVLLNYPLEWRYNESQALGDMNFVGPQLPPSACPPLLIAPSPHIVRPSAITRWPRHDLVHLRHQLRRARAIWV